MARTFCGYADTQGLNLFGTLSESPILKSSLQPKGWSIMEKVHESVTDPIYVGISHGRVHVRIGDFAPRTASLSPAEARAVAHKTGAEDGSPVASQLDSAIYSSRSGSVTRARLCSPTIWSNPWRRPSRSPTPLQICLDADPG
jgi:hypothetical protein